MLRSICVLVDKSGDEGHKDYPYIKKETPILDVINIVLDPLSDGSISPETVDLCPSGKSGTDLVLNVVSGDLLHELFNELGTLGSGTYEAHISLKDVEKLGQLVDAGLSDEFSDRCDSGIVLGGPALLFLLFALDPH